MSQHMKKSLYIFIALFAAVSCGTASKTASIPTGDGYEDEAVNVGYGTVNRRDNNFAVGSVKVNDPVIGTYENILDYLKARVPGIEVLGNGSVRVRGENSINLNTDALIMVDGIQMDDLKSINPTDVYSVDVLKDAAASAYGAKGANGVLLITTKGAIQAKEAEAAAIRAKREAARQARKEKKTK